MRYRLALFGLVLLPLAIGCARHDRTLPEEFPPVKLGMSHVEVRRALASAGAEIAEDNERLLRVVGRDRRVREEFFFFYKNRLATFTIRYPGAASRGAFQRQSRRFALTFGEPYEHSDNGLRLLSRWRSEEIGGRVLMSAFVGGGPDAALMVRVEDPSVVGRLMRQLSQDST